MSKRGHSFLYSFAVEGYWLLCCFVGQIIESDDMDVAVPICHFVLSPSGLILVVTDGDDTPAAGIFKQVVLMQCCEKLIQR